MQVITTPLKQIFNKLRRATGHLAFDNANTTTTDEVRSNMKPLLAFKGARASLPLLLGSPDILVIPSKITTYAKFWWDLRRFTYPGPALLESGDGSKHWYLTGKLHRDDGPAVEKADGAKQWWRNGELHRDDGPAVEEANGERLWFRNGEMYRRERPGRAATTASLQR